MEGFIGYITAAQQGALAARLRALSAAGSTAILTSPPTEDTRDEMLAMGVVLHHVCYDPVGAVAARFAAAGWAQRELLTRQRLHEQYGIQQHLDLLVLEA
jgi:O-methyltransferase involved in polyketide biosynthesis